MMIRFWLGGAAAVALAVGAVPALAQVPGAAPMAQGQNRAPRVHTRAEIPGQVQALFARLDANRDGLIAREEAKAAGQMKRGAGQRDQRVGGQQGQGQAQRAARDPMAAFDRMDLNRDGAITRQEFAARVANREQRQAAAIQRGGRGQRGLGGGVGLGGRMFDAADANRDSRVSLAEATAAAFRRFDSADANRDGQLTREERRQARGQRQRG
jgi:hypothetical protein